jgi:hypothetical protein
MRHAQRLALVTNQPLAGLDSQIELNLPVNLVDTLVVSFEAPDVARIKVAQLEGPVTAAVCQTQEPLGTALPSSTRTAVSP